MIENLLVRRELAYYIDLFISTPIIIFSILLVYIFGWVSKINVMIFIGIDMIFWSFMRGAYVSVFLSIFFTFLEMKFGGTFGKKILGLKVVSLKNSDKVTILQYAIRYYTRIFDFVLFVLCIPMLFNKGTKRFGDYLARTEVIRR